MSQQMFFNYRPTRRGIVLTLIVSGVLWIFTFISASIPVVLAAPVVGETCFATFNNGTTVYSSTTSQAVRSAVLAAPTGSVVKLAGYCAGVQTQNSTLQTVLLTKTLTLAGGYIQTNWITAYPITQPTTLDALNNGRVIYATTIVTLTNLTVQNGNLTGNGGGAYFDATAYITAVVFISNTSNGNGGGTYFNGNAYVANTAFSYNTATSSGMAGGAYFQGTANVENSTFNNNFLNAFAAHGAGAVFYGTAFITSTVFRNNQTSGFVTGGGGVYLYATGFASINHSVFDGNSGTTGGGLYSDHHVTIANSIFTGNTAGSGGGVYLESMSTGIIINTLFTRNSGQGAALMTNSPSVQILHSTFANANLSDTAAIYVGIGAVAITNTLFTSHTIGMNNSNGVISEDYNLFMGVTQPYAGAVSAGANSFTGTAKFINPLMDDYHLLADSAGIDVGANTNLIADFESDMRPYSGGFDIGYDEYAPSPACFVEYNGDSVTDLRSSDALAIQKAVTLAPSKSVIKIAGYCAGVQVINNMTQTLLITQALTLAGGYTTTNWATPNGATTLDAQNNGRVILATITTTLQGLTLTNGNAALSGANQSGGGLFTNQPVTLTSVIFFSNTAHYGGGAELKNTAIITGSTFQGNIATNGGGGAEIGNTGLNVIIQKSAFLSNTADDQFGIGTGGGLQLYDSPTVLIAETTFINNQAYGYNDDGGGAIMAYDDGNLTLKRVAMYNNRTLARGGAVSSAYGASGSLYFENTLFASNQAALGGQAISLRDNKTLQLLHATIATATIANGAAMEVTSGTVRITNTIIASYTVGVETIGGNVNESYTLFAGVLTPYSGTVVSGGNSFTNTAGFVNPALGDYHILSDSLAINAGMNSGLTIDFDGHFRPTGGGYDIGYDEFNISKVYLPLIKR